MLYPFDIQRVYFNSLIRDEKHTMYNANEAKNVNKDLPIGSTCCSMNAQLSKFEQKSDAILFSTFVYLIPFGNFDLMYRCYTFLPGVNVFKFSCWLSLRKEKEWMKVDWFYILTVKMKLEMSRMIVEEEILIFLGGVRIIISVIFYFLCHMYWLFC